MAADRHEALPVLPASAVMEEPSQAAWLIESLWSAEAVGLIGGAPKCCKTWLALDLAISVASNTPALGRFHVQRPGPVLFYGAEDGPAQLRSRLDDIARARGLTLDALDVGLILAPDLRLDTPRDTGRLAATIESHRPRLLILDPLVRLHRIDENSAAEISALLGDLRLLQRRYNLALILVHHLRKNAHAGAAAGQSLRGSGDLHAWGDSNLFLRKRDRLILLTTEHRAAPAPHPCTLELAEEPAPHLRVVDTLHQDHEVPDLRERIVAALADTGRPVSRDALRALLRARNAAIGDALVQLRAENRIERQDGGFVLSLQSAVPVPAPYRDERERNRE